MKGRIDILEWKQAWVVLSLAVGLALGTPVGSVQASGPQSEPPEPAVSTDADRIVGHWQRGESEAIIEVTKQGDAYRGVIVWSERRPETIGIEVFRGLRYDSHKRAWKGRAYSIKRKREVRIDIALPSSEVLELTAHILIFTREVEFARIPSAEIAARRTKPGI